MFVVIKPEVEKETGTNWDNSSQQNKMADVKIASMLKKSFCLVMRRFVYLFVLKRDIRPLALVYKNSDKYNNNKEISGY